MESISTGVPGLDRVLCGGLVPRSLNSIGGLPGTGKTSLAQQISHYHAKSGGKVLYLAALSETADGLVGHARGFSFFDPALIAQRIYYVSVYPKLEEGGLPSVLDEIRRLCMEHKVTMVCLDGMAALKSVAPSPLEFQRFVFDLNTQLRSLGATTLLLGHWSQESAADPEYTVSDGIITLSLEGTIEGATRYLEVLKLRGAENLPGPHSFSISGDGVEVFPRLESALHAEGIGEPPGEWTRVTTGTSGLDKMLHGGLPSGSVTLVSGGVGAGKTTLGLTFLHSGAEKGERGLYLGFGEAPSRLLTRADALGMNLRRQVDQGLQQLVWMPPFELSPDKVAWELLDLLDRNGSRRLVIDEIARLAAMAEREGRSETYLPALMAALRSRNVTTMVTREIGEADFPSPRSSFQQIETVVDNIIVIQYTEIESELRRVISVLKVRESDFDPVLREFKVSHGGLDVSESPLAGEAGISWGTRQQRGRQSQ